MFDIDINALRENLKGSTPVYFSYLKKDGSVRNALGTINQKLIPLEFRFSKDELNPNFLIENELSTNVKYFDLEKNGWRSISYDVSIVSILE
jgi:hypothetical protein